MATPTCDKKPRLIVLGGKYNSFFFLIILPQDTTEKKNDKTVTGTQRLLSLIFIIDFDRMRFHWT